MGERMLTFEDVLESALALSPVEKVRLVERLASNLQGEFQGPQLPERSLYGLCADLGSAPSGEAIDAIRQEAWANFPGEDIM